MPALQPLPLRLWCLLLLLVPGSLQQSITTLEVPNSVELGSNAELQCKFKAEAVEYVKWWFTPKYVPAEDRNPKLVYQHLSNVSPEVVRKNKTEIKEDDTIVLLDVEINDSGMYECEVNGGNDTRRHKNLTVFSNGTDHQLNVTKVKVTDDEDAIFVQCEVYNVTPYPELLLTINGEEIRNQTQSVTGGSNGLYDVTANATVASAEANDASFGCELFYQDKDVIHPRYMQMAEYKSSAGLLTTEAPEDTTHSEIATELPSGVSHVLASFWVLHAAAVVQLYVLF